jgi:hypothetical protein
MKNVNKILYAFKKDKIEILDSGGPNIYNYKFIMKNDSNILNSILINNITEFSVGDFILYSNIEIKVFRALKIEEYDVI